MEELQQSVDGCGQYQKLQQLGKLVMRPVSNAEVGDLTYMSGSGYATLELHTAWRAPTLGSLRTESLAAAGRSQGAPGPGGAHAGSRPGEQLGPECNRRPTLPLCLDTQLVQGQAGLQGPLLQQGLGACFDGLSRGLPLHADAGV